MKFQILRSFKVFIRQSLYLSGVKKDIKNCLQAANLNQFHVGVIKHHSSSKKSSHRLSSKRSESSVSSDSDRSYKSPKCSNHRSNYPRYNDTPHHYHYPVKSAQANHSLPYAEYLLLDPNIHSSLSAYPHATTPSQSLHQSPDYVPLPRSPTTMQRLSMELTMSASHFGLHTKNNAMYPPLTHESFPPSSPVKNKIKGCDPRLLLKEYLLWHKTQRPDLEFYWDKILERLEA